MIDFFNVSKSFSNNTVLNDISFHVNRNDNVAIVGKNGCGKSVLLKIASGLIEPTFGNVLINGEKISNIFFDNNDSISIGYVFQKGGLFDSMNIYDNIAFYLRRKNITERKIKDIVISNLTKVGLEGSENKMPSELSGGMLKRAGLARVLAINPKVILYDDPTAGLDPVLTDSIADLILEISKNENITSLTVTHDMKFAKKVSNKVLLLFNSKVVFWGDTSEFFLKNDIYAKQFINGDSEGPIGYL